MADGEDDQVVRKGKPKWVKPTARQKADRYLESQGLLNYQTRKEGLSQAEIAARYKNAGIKINSGSRWWKGNYGDTQELLGAQQGGQATQPASWSEHQATEAHSAPEPYNPFPKQTREYMPAPERYFYSTDPETGLAIKVKAPGSTVGLAQSGQANWTDVFVGDRRAELQDPNFYKQNKILDYPQYIQQQMLADPDFQWDKLPKWQQIFYNLSSSPAAMGAVNMGTTGLIAGTIAGGPVGGLIGGATAAVGGAIIGKAAEMSGYDQNKEAWQQGDGKFTLDWQQLKDISKGAFGWMNYAAEFAEKSIGLAAQTANAAADPNKTAADVWKDADLNPFNEKKFDAFNAGISFYEVITPVIESAIRKDWGTIGVEDALKIIPLLGMSNVLGNIILHPEQFKGEERYLGAVMPVELKQTWVERLEDARREVAKGRNYREVMTEMQSGVMAQLGDLVGQSVFDPLNVMPKMETGVGKIASQITGNKVAEAAFTGTAGFKQAWDKYRVIATTAGEAVKFDPSFDVAKLNAFERFVAGVNKQGEIKRGSLFGTQKGLLTVDADPKGKLFDETPQSRAETAAVMFSRNVGQIISLFDDFGKGVEFIKRIAKNDNKVWAELGSRIGNSAEWYTVLPAIKDFVTTKLEGMVKAREVALINRDILVRVADVLGDKPQSLVDDWAGRGTATQDYTRVVDRIRAAADNGNAGAKALLADIDQGSFTPQILEQIVGIFHGEGKVPLTDAEWKMQMYSELDDHFRNWVADKLALDKSPEAKSAFFKTMGILKTAQSIQLLGFSPGYAITNGLSGIVHLAVDGHFGMQTHGQMLKWVDRWGTQIPRMDEGVGIGGVVDTARQDPISKAMKGTGPLTEGKQILGRISRAMPFSKLSSFFESRNSMRGYVHGIQQYFSKSWRRGVGFKMMDPALVKIVQDMGIKPEHIYQAIEAGISQKEIEANLFGQYQGVKVQGLIHETAKALGLPVAETADMMNKVGLIDTLDTFLKGADTPDKVDAAFLRAEKKMRDWISMQRGEELKVRAEDVKNKVTAEGAKAALDVTLRAHAAFTDAWFDHYDRFGDVADGIDLIEDPIKRNLIYEIAYQQSEDNFAGVFADMGSHYQGIFDVWGLSNDPEAVSMLTAISEQHVVMKEAYDLMRSLRHGLTVMLTKEQRPPTSAELSAMNNRIDTAFKQAFESRRKAQVRQGEALKNIYTKRHGVAAGEAARLWWEDVTNHSDAITKDEQKFRDDIWRARQMGATKEQIKFAKKEYYSTNKVRLIAELELINQEGIARLERVVMNKDVVDTSAAPVAEFPAPVRTDVVDQPLTPDLPTEAPGEIPENVRTLAANNGVDIADGMTTFDVLKEIKAKAQPAPEQAAPSKKAPNRQQKATAESKALEASAQKHKTQMDANYKEVLDIAAQYPPYLNKSWENYHLLYTLQKTEYGGDPSILSLRDPSLTPDKVRTILEKRSSIKAEEARVKAEIETAKGANPAQQAITKPRSEIDPRVSEVLAREAVRISDVISGGEPGKRIFNRDPNNGEQGRLVVSATSSTYPAWYGELSKLNGGKRGLLKALDKIVEDHGKDKGVVVERVKEFLLSNLKFGDPDTGSPPNLSVLKILGADDATLQNSLDIMNDVLRSDYTLEQVYQVEGLLADEIGFTEKPGTFDAAAWMEQYKAAVDQRYVDVMNDLYASLPDGVESDVLDADGETFAEYHLRNQINVEDDIARDYQQNATAQAKTSADDMTQRAADRAEAVTTRTLMLESWTEIFGSEQAQAYMELSDAIAQWYERTTGGSADEFYSRYYEETRRATESGDRALYQDKESAEGAQAYQRNITDGKAKLQEAVDQKKDTPNAFYRPEIGEIDLVWGEAGDPARDYKGGYGLSHIIEKRTSEGVDGKAFAKDLYLAIANGDAVYRGEDIGDPRIDIFYRDTQIVLVKESGKVNSWMLTGFIKQKISVDTGDVRRSPSATQSQTPGVSSVTGSGDNFNIAQDGTDGNIKTLSDGRPASATAEASKQGSKDRLLQKISEVNAKGAVTFDADGIRATIHAFESADFSTLVHENAHIFRRVMKDVAERTGNAQVINDLATIEAWAGVKDGNWTVSAEEKFARGFERYIANGEAPTPKLRKAFETFKGWMVQIYRTIKGSDIGVALTPEVRSVFDRMLSEADMAPLKVADTTLYQRNLKAIKESQLDMFAGRSESIDQADMFTPGVNETDAGTTGGMLPGMQSATGMMFDVQEGGSIRKMEAPTARTIYQVDPNRTAKDSAGADLAAGDIVTDTNGRRHNVEGANVRGKIVTKDGRVLDPKDVTRVASQGDLFSLPPEPKPIALPDVVPAPGKLADFGEKLGGARKDKAQFVERNIADADIAKLSLTEIWPKAEVDKIEDVSMAAFSTVLREAIPSKPRDSWKLRRWVESVKMIRELVKHASENGVEATVAKVREYSSTLRDLQRLPDKMTVLTQIPREKWSRIGTVENRPGAAYYKDGVYTPSPHAVAEVDGVVIRADSLDELTTKVVDKLDVDAAKASVMKFEIRGNGKQFFINKVGDPLYRKLVTFDTVEAAREYKRENADALVKAWEGVKESDNVKETDVRRAENRPRAGKDYRQGKDATPEMFNTFGFRGVEFGNWVSQGGNLKERQGMLNAAYDGLMDLADIVHVPPKALSLNGTLGLGLGSRGSGWASAHFEPDTIVINLTKTRGAGSLAHEWLHALDNYFQRRREGAVKEKMITYQPENYYQNARGDQVSATRFDYLVEKNIIKNKSEWKMVEGVRPEVAEAFAELVKKLDASPMTKRAKLIDKGKKGYWSSIVERAARSFEGYIIFKMAQDGYQNDYLANVQSIEDFPRDPSRYPYLLNEELAPVVEAFDNLFNTVKVDDTGMLYQTAPTDPFKNADLPLGTVEDASQIMPIAATMEEGFAKQVKPLMDAMKELAKEQVVSKPLDGATRDMSPEGQAMLRKYTNQVKADLASTKNAATKWGEKQRDNSMLNYSKRYGIDRYAEVIFPYQFFYTRSLMTWAARALEKPALFSTYARLKRQQERYERDVPERLRGKIKINMPWLPDWMGDALYIDPMATLFTPLNYLKPFERKNQEITQQQLEAERVLQEWMQDESVPQAELIQAAKTREGKVWERAFAEAQLRREGEINTPLDFLGTMLGPAWYLTTPLKLLGITGIPGSPGGKESITSTPMLNTARAIDTVTQGTWAEPIGDVLGLIGRPEEMLREKLGIPEFGEYGDYYIDRQLANMVADKLISAEEAQMAMVERSGPTFDAARERVKYEMAMRVPTSAALMAGLTADNFGQGIARMAATAPASMFGAGLLPAGELEYRGLKQEWNEMWRMVDAGDESAKGRFFDNHPEYSAYLAKGKKPEERMASFLVGQIWDGYYALGTTDRKSFRAAAEGFEQAFMDEETRAPMDVDTDTLVRWAQMLSKAVPNTPTTATAIKSPTPPVTTYDRNITKITDQYFRARSESFPNYYEEQQGYFALPKSEQKSYLRAHPSLKAYWDFNDGWNNAYPELSPIFKNQVFKRVDTSAWSPLLVDAVGVYAMTGDKLGKGAWKALEQQWIMAGSPYGDLKSWLNNEVVPAMLYTPESQP